MAYKIPAFPTTMNIWRYGNAPPFAPDVVSAAQLTPGRRSITPYVGQPANVNVPAVMHALMPIGTDIRDGKAAAGPDTCEAPAGSGRMYNVQFVDDIGLGFA